MISHGLLPVVRPGSPGQDPCGEMRKPCRGRLPKSLPAQGNKSTYNLTTLIRIDNNISKDKGNGGGADGRREEDRKTKGKEEWLYCQ